MALQPEDLPSQFGGTQRDGSLNLEGESSTGSSAAYRRMFTSESADVQPGTASCVETSLSLYARPEAAHSVLAESLNEAASASGLSPIEEADVGEESAGFTFVAGNEVCNLGIADRGSAISVVSRSGQVISTVLLVALEGDASADEAVNLARKQAQRVEAVLTES